jgi:hypothetical protein
MQAALAACLRGLPAPSLTRWTDCFLSVCISLFSLLLVVWSQSFSVALTDDSTPVFQSVPVLDSIVSARHALWRVYHAKWQLWQASTICHMATEL